MKQISISLDQEAMSILERYKRVLRTSRSAIVDIALRYMAGERGNAMTRRMVEAMQRGLAEEQEEQTDE